MNAKFDFDIINAIQSKTVTAGEFVSSILPCNNFDDINSNLSILAGNDFAGSLKRFKVESIKGYITENSNNFITNCDIILSDIKRIFELRHIFCHKFATNVKIDKDEIFRCFYNSKIFLTHTNKFIWNLLYPNTPETALEMSKHANETFIRVDTEMKELIET